jgi:maltooligosyltrehalose trehalohydrolase
VFRAASLLFLLLPHTPLLFMGQEWAALSPFLYFTDHTPDLGRLVTEGRRREFATFTAFSDAATRVRIPDPQAVATFEASRLDWSERDREPHASILRLYQATLRYRHQELRHDEPGDAATAFAPDDDTVAFRRTSRSGDQVLVVARLRGAGTLDLGRHQEAHGFSRVTPVFTSEDAAFASRPHPPVVETAGDASLIRFAVAATVVLRQADS